MGRLINLLKVTQLESGSRARVRNSVICLWSLYSLCLSSARMNLGFGTLGKSLKSSLSYWNNDTHCLLNLLGSNKAPWEGSTELTVRTQLDPLQLKSA